MPILCASFWCNLCVLFRQLCLYVLNGNAQKSGHMDVCFGKRLAVADAHRLHTTGVSRLNAGCRILKDDTLPRQRPQLCRPL